MFGKRRKERCCAYKLPIVAMFTSMLLFGRKLNCCSWEEEGSAGKCGGGIRGEMELCVMGSRSRLHVVDCLSSLKFGFVITRLPTRNLGTSKRGGYRHSQPGWGGGWKQGDSQKPKSGYDWPKMIREINSYSPVCVNCTFFAVSDTGRPSIGWVRTFCPTAQH